MGTYNLWMHEIDNGATQYLGLYQLEHEAASAYDAAASFISGSRAVVNFPEVNYDIVNVPRTPPQWLIEIILTAVCGVDAWS